ncbi:hypothetical protein LIER_24553 [Lithospermum erythrorhizon]|uniref:Uncharacterized protein n=1 Tax=Lithospermum erythrorhizon TaxID=34254 RepID=A0AAV3R5J0_LITER
MASRLNDEDIEGYPLDANTLSVEPLSIRHPSNSATNSSQARTTPSSSQTAGPTQADTNADKPGDIPTIIHNSLPVAFSDEDLVNFRQYFSITSTVEMGFPLEGEQMFEPLGDPSHSDGPSAPGWTSMYIKSLSYGARFPFGPFVDELLIAVNRAPRQISPSG